MGHKLLPTNVKIPSIKKNVGWGCLRCRGGNMTAIHAFKDCLKARAILSHDGIDDRLFNYDYERYTAVADDKVGIEVLAEDSDCFVLGILGSITWST
ncbi:hypothetical protein Godav_004280 [Gossypium davidsonii]|uniref:Reverse transcriptase zinc-binding domain-containing protein n=1 Tax=Gossypium davidsonii TaxID=34287 RepID=A0A7J8SKQ4_GOSDV|nr:hypothetical protein [Gossypium davidsonii]